MKKIIGVVFASLMFANIGFAEMKLIEYAAVGPTDSKGYFSVATICVDGYKFVLYGTSSLVQFYEAGNNQSPIPVKC